MKLPTVLKPAPEQLSLPIVGRMPNPRSDIGSVDAARHLEGDNLRGLLLAVGEFVRLRRRVPATMDKAMPALAEKITAAADRIEDAWEVCRRA